MQRNVDDGIIIACDFCGSDWDQVAPMVEGHRGSVLCLGCLEESLKAIRPAASPIQCSLCLRELPAGTPCWSPPTRAQRANPVAVVCESCVDQAARAFDKDPDVDWKKPR